MKRMMRMMILGVMAAWMAFASTAHATLAQIDFFLTLERQMLWEVPVNGTTVVFSTTKLKFTTKDMLSVIANHYDAIYPPLSDPPIKAYPPGSTLTFDIYGTGEDAEGDIEVIAPDGVTVLQEVEPSVFKIDRNGLLEPGFGEMDLLKSGTANVVTGNETKRLTTFVRYVLDSEFFELTLVGILREKVSLTNQGATFLLKASAIFDTLGEGFINATVADGEDEDTDPDVVSHYVIVSGKYTLTKQLSTLVPIPE